VKGNFNKGDEVEVGLMAPGGCVKSFARVRSPGLADAEERCCIGVSFDKYLEYSFCTTWTSADLMRSFAACGFASSGKAACGDAVM